jgi:hypothetical protein
MAIAADYTIPARQGEQKDGQIRLLRGAAINMRP